MFVHHIVTIMLLTFSWTSNLFRVGSLVLVIHDFADVPLEVCRIILAINCIDLSMLCSENYINHLLIIYVYRTNTNLIQNFW